MNRCGTVLVLSVLSLAWATASAASVEAAGERSPKGHHAFKGYELYSWRTATGDWRYALLPGTNRVKDWREVEAGALPEQELYQAIAELPSGESVSWCNDRDLGQGAELVKPPKPSIQALLDLARRHEVKLDLCEQEEGDAPAAEQNEPVVETDVVKTIEPASSDKVAVHFQRHAAVYFLSLNQEHSDEWLARLRESRDTGKPVSFTFDTAGQELTSVELQQ